MPTGVTSFNNISTNPNFSCAIANTGTVYCWGTGTSGQIGNGNNINESIPTAVTMPAGVDNFSNITTANNGFTCGNTNTGTTYCWGVGTSGQIGNSASLNVSVPTAVTMPVGTSFSRISNTISDTNCAIANSGTHTGIIYCWGNNTSGQTGNGNNYIVNTASVVTIPNNITGFNNISTNINFSCAIATIGTIYCWGIGTSGQIGNNASLNVSVPTAVIMPAGVISFNSISTNSSFSCAIASSGTTPGVSYCWGTGTSGQIGNGANSSVNVPTAVIMPAGVSSFGYITTTGGVSCGVAGNGSNANKIYCWGLGTSGQIGNESQNNANVPTYVIGT